MNENNNQNPNNQGSNNNSNNNNKAPQRKQSLLFLLIASLITLVCMSFFMNSVGKGASREITYDEFVKMLDAGEVKSVEITPDQINILPVKNEAENDELYTPLFDPFSSSVTASLLSALPV